MTLVPAVVPLPLASRHSVVPETVRVSCPLEVCVHVWFAAPLHAQICCWVARVVVEFGSSRHLPAATACSAPVAVPLPPTPYPAAAMLAWTEFSVASDG